jgi:hypothetical protein
VQWYTDTIFESSIFASDLYIIRCLTRMKDDIKTPIVHIWSFSFKRDLFLLYYRMKDDVKTPLLAWLDAL